MREVTERIYKFEELSEDVQQKVIEREAQQNIDYDWHQFIYMDAENIGIRITGFNLDYFQIEGLFINGMGSGECVANTIRKEHGESYETYKLAGAYLHELMEIPTDNQIDCDPHLSELGKDNLKEESEEKRDQLEKEFLHDLLEEYLALLRKEYEWQTSEECIRESLINNECEFYENGKPYN